MSLEAWGDEGSGTDHWEETAVAQDFVKVREAFYKWVREHKPSEISPDHEALVRQIGDAMDDLSEGFTGKIN